MNTSSSIRRLRHREADLAGLIQAAERAFSERGYHGTSVRDIAREAGFSVGGVYQFFPSKDELYLRIVEEQWAYFFRLVNEVFETPGFARRLEGLTDAMFRAFEERRGFFRLFLSERGRLSPAFTGEIAARIALHTKRLRQQLSELMRQGIDEGCLRDADPDMLASAFIGMAHHCIFEALAAGAERPSRPASQILALFLDGAAAEPAAHGVNQ
jgi:TetR/AcrR family fatty acid metabolism transcriptional regulator